MVCYYKIKLTLDNMFFEGIFNKKPENIPKTKIEPVEEAKELPPLTPNEKKKLKEFFEPRNNEDNFLGISKDALFDISQMGERIIPLLLSDEGKIYRDNLGIDLKNLLETVVSKKTAPFVLSAMKEGKIGLWHGALAATMMGKKALDGLGHLLEDLEPGSSGGRSGQCELIKALSSFGDDKAIPFFKKFFKKVQNKEKKEGYPCKTSDAYEILEALGRIHTPAANAYIKKLSASADVNAPDLKEFGDKLLLGLVYIEPVSFEIIFPPPKPPATELFPHKIEKPKKFTPKEKLFLAVEEVNPDLRPFIEGKLISSKSLAEAISSHPAANYVHIAELLEEEGSPENKMRSGFLIGQYSSFIAQIADSDVRQQLWQFFIRHVLDLQNVLMDKNFGAVMTYHQIKEILFGGAIGDKSGEIRKNITQSIVKLSINGNDEEISRTLSQILRQVGHQAKGGSRMRLNPSQELALRGLFNLRDANANTELARLLVNKDVDPRLKKLCLKNLTEKGYFDFQEKVKTLAENYLQRDSRDIPWKELIFLLRVHLIADKEIRRNIEGKIFPQFSCSFTEQDKSMHNKWRDLCPNIPPELFVVCWVLVNGEKEYFEYLNKLFGNIKSKAVRESYLFALTEFQIRYSPDSGVYFRDMLSFPQDKDFPQTMLRILTNCIVITSSERLNKIRDLFFSVRDPSILLKKIEKEASEEFMQCLGAEESKIISKQIRKFIDCMSDPRPFFIYASRLGDEEQMTKNLFKTMIQHFDYPEMRDWKIWKYDRSDKYVKDQLMALSDQQIQAYSRDRFMKAEELLVGILPTEKAGYIQESVMHSFLHDDHWKIEGDGASLRFVFARLHEFFKTHSSEGTIFTDDVRAEISRLNQLSDALSRFGLLLKDDALSVRAGETINRFQKQKSERAKRLISLGLKGEESDKDLASIIQARRGRYFLPENEKAADLFEKEGKTANYLKLAKRLEYLKQKEGKMEEKQEVEEAIKILEQELKEKLGNDFQHSIETHRFIRSLSALRQPEFDPDFAAFLEKWKIDEASTNEQIAVVQQAILRELAEIQQSDLLKDIKDFFGMVPSAANEAREAAQNINIARNILRLAALTPHLIVFDRISSDLPKKSLSLSKVVEDLQKKFSAYPKLSQDFSNIREKLQEISAPWKEEKMAMVVTDHPLVALTIGKYPYGAESCQGYYSGSPELLSYMVDASTKFNLLIDIGKLPDNLQEALAGTSPDDEDAKIEIFNGHVDKFLPAIVARRVLKIVKNGKTGDPYCFLEPVYTPLNRQIITNHMDYFAKTELGPSLGFAIVNGAKINDSEGFDVKVAESRNVVQYEDGASGGPGGNGIGLGVFRGSYTMPAKFL